MIQAPTTETAFVASVPTEVTEAQLANRQRLLEGNQSQGPLKQSTRKTTRQYQGVVRNVFEAILRYGHDEDFIPFDGSEHFHPTDAPAGSAEKIEVLRKRVELGVPLWHKNDRVDYHGLSGAIRPRN